MRSSSFQTLALRLHPVLHRQPQQRHAQVSQLQELPREVQGRPLNTKAGPDQHLDEEQKAIFGYVKESPLWYLSPTVIFSNQFRYF